MQECPTVARPSPVREMADADVSCPTGVPRRRSRVSESARPVHHCDRLADGGEQDRAEHESCTRPLSASSITKGFRSCRPPNEAYGRNDDPKDRHDDKGNLDAMTVPASTSPAIKLSPATPR